jgi:hypothetical protein
MEILATRDLTIAMGVTKKNWTDLSGVREESQILSRIAQT